MGVSTTKKILVFLATVVVCVLLAGVVQIALQQPMEEADRVANKWLQIVVSILTFVLPAVLYLSICKRWATVSFRLKHKTGYIYAFVAYVLTAFVLMIGASIASADVLNYIKEQYPILVDIQTKNNEMLQYFLHTSSTYEWWLNVVMIAVLPAVGEELFFRVMLHDVFGTVVKNAHALAMLTALMFSLPHFNVDGFLPIFIVGMLLSYFWQYSHSFFLIFAIHFTNNFVSLLAYEGGINPNDTPVGVPYYYGLLLLLVGWISLRILLSKLRRMDMVRGVRSGE